MKWFAQASSNIYVFWGDEILYSNTDDILLLNTKFCYETEYYHYLK